MANQVTEKKPVSRGWSFGWLLLGTAVVGIVGGAILGGMGEDLAPEVVAEREVAKMMPRPAPPEPGDPMAPSPASLSGIPPYPGVYPRRLIDKAELQATPVAISWFSTQDSTAAVLDFYEKAFRAEGRRPFSQRRGPDMGYVAWLDAHPDAGPGAGVLHMVSAMKQFSQTMVLISASRPDLAMNANPQIPQGLELPPNSSEPQVVNIGESLVASQIVYARTLNLGPPEVVQFFRAQFEKKGFVVSEEAEAPNQAGITGTRAGISVVVGVRAEGSHSSIVLTYDRKPQEGGSR